MRRLSILVAAFALGFAVMPAATAQRTSMLEAEFGGFGFPTFDPTAVEERCPESFMWIFNTVVLGGGMTTPEFDGPIEPNPMGEPIVPDGQHCSRWKQSEPTNPDKWYPGQVGAGMLTLSTSEGDLVVRYRGIFNFRGDLSVDPPEYLSKITLFYRIDGDASTGVFAGARGVGLMKVIDKFEDGEPSFHNIMRGPIRFAD